MLYKHIKVVLKFRQDLNLTENGFTIKIFLMIRQVYLQYYKPVFFATPFIFSTFCTAGSSTPIYFRLRKINYFGNSLLYYKKMYNHFPVINMYSI